MRLERFGKVLGHLPATRKALLFGLEHLKQFNFTGNRISGNLIAEMRCLLGAVPEHPKEMIHQSGLNGCVATGRSPYVNDLFVLPE